MEKVKVETEIPGRLFDFLMAVEAFSGMSIPDYFRHTIIAAVEADINTMSSDNAFWGSEDLKKKYVLHDIFRSVEVKET